MVMKIKIEIDEDLAEEEIVIRCKSLNEDAISIQKRIADAVNSRMQLEVSKGAGDSQEYYRSQRSGICRLEQEGFCFKKLF